MGLEQLGNLKIAPSAVGPNRVLKNLAFSVRWLWDTIFFFRAPLPFFCSCFVATACAHLRKVLQSNGHKPWGQGKDDECNKNENGDENVVVLILSWQRCD